MKSLPSASGRRVLVVDDDPAIGLLLGQLLEHEGYRIARAADGREALARAAEFQPDLVLLDLDLPQLGGYEVCRRLKQDPATRLLPVLILTGQSSSEARVRAWDLGADDFLTKPFQPVDVRARCRSLLRLKGLVDELDSAQAVVFAFARAVEAKSPYTQGHAARVTTYALALAELVGVSAPDREVLRKGAVLHDIGKIWVPDAILNKPGPLNAEEFELVKQHPLQGVRIVEPLRSIRDAIPLIRWHHERPDGRGYPDGLAGEAIPLLVRILSVADVYDALASARPYRPAMDHADCLVELRRMATGGGLDLELVHSFAGAVTGPCCQQSRQLPVHSDMLPV
jgi:putative two-component system response regulator